MFVKVASDIETILWNIQHSLLMEVAVVVSISINLSQRCVTAATVILIIPNGKHQYQAPFRKHTVGQ